MSEDEFKVKMLAHAESQEKFQQKVSTALFGDQDAQIPGLAKRVSDSEKYIEKDKKFKQKVAGGLFVISIAGVPITEWIKQKLGF